MRQTAIPIPSTLVSKKPSWCYRGCGQVQQLRLPEHAPLTQTAWAYAGHRAASLTLSENHLVETCTCCSDLEEVCICCSKNDCTCSSSSSSSSSCLACLSGSSSINCLACLLGSSNMAPWCSCPVAPPTLQSLAHLSRCNSPRKCTLHGSTAYPASASLLIKHHPLMHACFMQSQHRMKPLHPRGRNTCMACSSALKNLCTPVHNMHICSIRKCTCKYRCAQQMLIAAAALRCDQHATAPSLCLPCLRQQHLRFGCPVSATTSLSYSTTTHRSRLLASASSRCLACSSALEILDAQHRVSPPLILRGRYKVNLANETPNNHMWSREGAASATHRVASCNQHLSV